MLYSYFIKARCNIASVCYRKYWSRFLFFRDAMITLHIKCVHSLCDMFDKKQANGKPNPILFDDLKMVYVGFVVENT